jgi:IclR family pca regulon transcriptional regulator
MHAIPSGLVLLAEWPLDALDAYMSGELVALTSRTVTDPGDLRARLAEVRERGYAWGLEEFAEGIDSVAAPIRDGRGKAIAAIHVHGPSYRFPPARREAFIAARLVAASAAASAQLSGG